MSNPVPADVVKDGDTVTVQFVGPDGSTKPADLITSTGRLRVVADGDLMLGYYIVAHANGNSGPDVACITHRLPAEPPVGSMVLDCDGDYWAHVPDGWVLIKESASRHAWKAVGGEYDFKVVTG